MNSLCLTDHSKVVIIFPDHGSRYMSKIYNDKWMRDQGFFDSISCSRSTKSRIHPVTTSIKKHNDKRFIRQNIR